MFTFDLFSNTQLRYHSGRFTNIGLTFVPSWISNYLRHNVSDKKNIPKNFNSAPIEVCELLTNCIRHLLGYVITYPFYD